MNKQNARDMLSNTCHQFCKITGEVVAITFTWNGKLSVYGPDAFKEFVKVQRDEVWERLSHTLPQKQTKQNQKSKPLVDENMENLLKGDLRKMFRGTLRKLVSWATQRSIGCGRNFWGVEDLKPIWWPETIKFDCISKLNATKDTLIVLLNSYLKHNPFEVVSNSSTSEKENTSEKTNMPKNIRTNSQSQTPNKEQLLAAEIDDTACFSYSTMFGDNQNSTTISQPISSSTPKRKRTEMQSETNSKKQKFSSKIEDSINISNITQEDSFFQGLSNKTYTPVNPIKENKNHRNSILSVSSCSDSYELPKTILHPSQKEKCLAELSQPNKWLNDITINSFCKLIKHSYPAINGLQDTLLSQKLRFKKSVYDTPSVQIHDCGNHWVCSSHDGHGIYLYDSLYMRKTSENLDTQLALLYADESQQLEVTVPSTQQQRGSSECGLYALAVATAIAAGIKPETQSWNQELMRTHCLKCIEEEEASPFPTYTVRAERHGKLPKPHKITIDLMCNCNLPIYAFVGQNNNSVTHTVQCDYCSNWYHNECVGLPNRSTIDGSFCCKTCQSLT